MYVEAEMHGTTGIVRTRVEKMLNHITPWHMSRHSQLQVLKLSAVWLQVPQGKPNEIVSQRAVDEKRNFEWSDIADLQSQF